MNVSIRSYTVADKEACLDAFKSNMPAYFVAKELVDFEHWLSVGLHARHAADEVWKYFVVKVNGGVKGCGGFVLEQAKSEARMTWGLIHRDAHRSGLGRRLLEWRISAIRAIDPLCTIALDTTQHAASFFEKTGFRITQITPNGYAPGMDRYDMVYVPDAGSELNPNYS